MGGWWRVVGCVKLSIVQVCIKLQEQGVEARGDAEEVCDGRSGEVRGQDEQQGGAPRAELCHGEHGHSCRVRRQLDFE